MEPITVAGAFGTIVNLLATFRRERQSQEILTKQDFADWLDKHGFSEIRELIIDTRGLAVEVEQLLTEDRALLLQKFSSVEDMLAQLLSRIDGFSGIVGILKPSPRLRDQAVNVLRRLVQSEAEGFLLLAMDQGYELRLVRSGGVIPVSEPRFLEDDLNTLVSLGLLLLDHTGRDRFYRVTRTAEDFVAVLDYQNTEGSRAVPQIKKDLPGLRPQGTPVGSS